MAFMKPLGDQLSFSVDHVQYDVVNGVLELPDPYIEVAKTHGFVVINESEIPLYHAGQGIEEKATEVETPKVSSLDTARAKIRRSKAS